MNKIKTPISLLMFLCLLIVFLWFHKGLLFAGGEEGISFYDLGKTTQLYSHLWWEVSAGYSSPLIINRLPYFAFLNIFHQVGFSNYLIQALHFFIIMTFGSISIYFLIKVTVAEQLKENDKLFKLVPLIGAVFYLLNPFSMTQIWGRGLYLQFFPFALFPFLLLMFILGLRHKNFIYGSLALLASLFFAGAYGNPSYIISQWMLLFIYMLYYIYRNRIKKEIIFSFSYFLFLLIGWTLIQMWWIYPFVKTASNPLSLALDATAENIGTVKGLSKYFSLPSLIRLIHEDVFYNDYRYGSSYFSATFHLISLIIPLMFLFSLSVFRKTKYYLFYFSLFLISLFMCLGYNFPTGKIFIFLFKSFPILQSFRNPFEKFGIILTLAYAPFFALGLVVFSQKVAGLLKGRFWAKLTCVIVSILVFGIFLWPIWTGHFAGGFKISPWVKVPEYYKQTNDWLNKQKDDGRIIHFPINPGDGIRYSEWQSPYQGIEPSEFIFDRPSIGKNGQLFKPYYNVLLQRLHRFQPLAYGPDPDLSNSEFKSEYLYEELGKLNVRYIILHKDISPYVGNIGFYSRSVNYLADQSNIKYIQSFGKLDIYKVDIPSNISLIYSPNAKTQYKKKSPVLYEVSVNVSEPFSLYFLENFNPNWEAYIDNEKILDHSKVFSYANSWKIEKIGDLKIVLKYKPQDYANKGAIVSLIVFSILFLLLVFNYLMNKLIKK